MSGTGIISDPWDLATALAYPAAVRPGDTFWLRAGTYTGEWLSYLGGTTNRPITIKPYQEPGQSPERVIIDGHIWAKNSRVVFQGLEFTHSAQDGTNLAGLETSGVSGKISVINCIIHDAEGSGCGFWRNVQPGLFYGNLVYFNGRQDPGQNHGLYTQNVAGVVKTIKDNIIWGNWGYGIHAYGSAYMDDFSIIGNTIFGNAANCFDFHIGGNAPFSNPTLTSNYIYGTSRVGYGSGNTVTNAKINGNYFVNPTGAGALTLTTCVPTEFGSNYFYGTRSGWTDGDYPTNTYGAGIPDAAFVRGNEYDVNRANLTVYNGSSANTIDVNVSALFGQSGTVKAHNAQDYFSDIQTLTITAGVITVNMQAANRTVQTPVGVAAPAKSFPKFGAFILVKQ
jgi:hypothetical protein